MPHQMEHMRYKLPAKISTVKWAKHIFGKNILRGIKIRFLYPVRKRLKNRFIADTITLPSPKVIMKEMEQVDAALIEAGKNRNDRLAQRLEGKKELLRWIINYER